MSSLYGVNYAKNNSPKAREILRLSEMLLRLPEATREGERTRFATGGIVIEGNGPGRATSYSIRIWQRGDCRSLLNMMTMTYNGNKPERVITFYAKKASTSVLAAIHEKLPLEALAYYGCD